MKLIVKPITTTHEQYWIPSYGSDCAAGLDLYSNAHFVVTPGQRICVTTGIAIEWVSDYGDEIFNIENCNHPSNYYMRIAPRSGLAMKYGIDVGAGVIDSDYRGEIKVILFNHGDKDFEINPGDRIAQAILTRIVRFETVELATELSDSSRGTGGFGSTGTK